VLVCGVLVRNKQEPEVSGQQALFIFLCTGGLVFSGYDVASTGGRRDVVTSFCLA
jgi:hypothetical protein